MNLSGTTMSRALLEPVIAKLEGTEEAAERQAHTEACFRLALLPDTEIEYAISLLRRAIQSDPFHPKLFFHLGRLLHKDGAPLEAVLQYRETLRLASRSHRTYLHLALALSDLGGEDRKLSQRILDALHCGDDLALAALIVELDNANARRFGEKEKEIVGKETAGEKSKQHCRWGAIWELAVLNELTKPSPSVKAATQNLEEGKRLIQPDRGASEYALAILFFVLDGPRTCRQAESWLREPILQPYKDTAALRLVQAACGLGEARNVAEFVELASELLENGTVPLELICCLHYCWYGAADIAPAKALEALDVYPLPFQSSPCLRELRLAVLDHHARAAWNSERVDRAEVLWQETIRLDPFRIAVAHNLAVAATRAESTDKYPSAWARAAELRYLTAASAGDLRFELEDRIKLHKSFAQQSRLRYLPEDGKVSEQALRNWLKDREALTVWLYEDELALLNSRLKFRSPVCLLGLAQDCSAEEADSAKKSMDLQFDLCLRARQWAGCEVFLSLVHSLTEKACLSARDPLQRKRDPYVDGEMAAARALGIEAFERGFLMFRMIKVAQAEELDVTGLEIASFLLRMPWQSLVPLARRSGRLSEDTELIPVFLSYVCGLALQKSKESGPAQYAEKVCALKDCMQAMPEDLDLRLVLCRLYLDGKRNKEAYQAALEALPMAAKMADRDQAARLEAQFATCVDNAAMSEIPDGVLSPGPNQVRETITYCRRVLDDFPRAGGLRLLIARCLIQTVEEEPSRLSEARVLLEGSLDLLLTEKQIHEARDLIEKVGSRSTSLDSLKKVRALIESATAHARKAVSLAKERTPSQERIPAKMREARQELEEAIAETAQAEELAAEASLQDAVERARTLAANLRQLLEGIEKD